MKNRAKCKLCNSIIESFFEADNIECKCGEISVSGGTKMYCAAKNWINFLRVDDHGNAILVKVKDIGEPNDKNPTFDDMLSMLDDMIRRMEELPNHAMSQPINHYDWISGLSLIGLLLREARKSSS